MKTIIKVAAGIAVGSLLVIGGCVALIGAGADKAQKDSDKTAITEQQYKQIKPGMRKQVVVKRLGKPLSKQETEIDSKELGRYNSSCIYYHRKGELASLYQFCFSDGRLESKGSY